MAIICEHRCFYRCATTARRRVARLTRSDRRQLAKKMLMGTACRKSLRDLRNLMRQNGGQYGEVERRYPQPAGQLACLSPKRNTMFRVRTPGKTLAEKSHGRSAKLLHRI